MEATRAITGDRSRGLHLHHSNHLAGGRLIVTRIGERDCVGSRSGRMAAAADQAAAEKDARGSADAQRGPRLSPRRRDVSVWRLVFVVDEAALLQPPTF